MHTFQPITQDFMDVNPFNMIAKDGMLVTSGTKDSYNTTIAIGGGLGVLWESNVAFIVIKDSKYINEFIDKTGKFSLTFFDGSFKKELKYIGAVSGRDEDKLSNAMMNINFHESSGTPFIDEGKMVLICECVTVLPISAKNMDPSMAGKQFDPNDQNVMYVGKSHCRKTR